LLCKSFLQGYTFWCCHGEPILVNGDGMKNIEYEDPMQIMINDAFGLSNMYTNEESFTPSFEHIDDVEGGVLESQHGGNIMAQELFDLLKDVSYHCMMDAQSFQNFLSW